MKQRLRASQLTLLWAIPLTLMITAAVSVSLSDRAHSGTASDTNSYRAFTSIPDVTTQDRLLRDLRQQAIDPVADMPATFREMVLSGHPLALEIAFEMLSVSDGADAAVFSQLLGNTVVSNPEAFLHALTQYLPSVDRLDALLGDLDGEYIDNLQASTRELEDRYYALRNVDSETYSEAREQALLVLGRMILQNRERMAGRSAGQ